MNAEFTLLERCGRNLAGVLKGTINPLEVLFPGGSLATLEKLYQDSPASQACNGLVQAAVTAVVEKLPKGRSLRVLEIGAGTGGTTTYVLPVLRGIASEYVFTDVSPQFTSKAEAKFRDYPFVRYQILDIERPPSEQGFRPHEFDIVLAANVLHATADLRQVLGHVKQLLSPQGLVVMLEGTGPQRWLDLIFGMTEGWWKFRDDDVRESHPLLRQDKWLALLEECGFVDAVAIPGAEESGRGVPEPALIMARAAEVLPAPRSPDSVMTSPGPIRSARSAMRCAVAVSLRSAVANLDGPLIRRHFGGRLGRAENHTRPGCRSWWWNRNARARHGVPRRSAPARGPGRGRDGAIRSRDFRTSRTPCP